MKKLLFTFLLAIVTIVNTHAQDVKEPTSPDYTKAKEALEEGDFFTADSLLSEEVRKHPKNGYAWLYRGGLYASLEADTAITYLDQAVRLLPKKDKENLGYAYFWRASAKWRIREDFDGLVADIRAAQRTNPSIAAPSMMLAQVLTSRGDYEGAEKELRLALTKNDVKKVDAYQFLGRNKMAQGDPAAAIRFYDQALEFDRNDETVYIDRSQAYLAQNNDDKGIDDAVKAFGMEYSRNSFSYLCSLGDSTELQEKVVSRIEAETHKVSDPTVYNFAISYIYGNAEKEPESLRYLLRASKTSDEPLYEQIAEKFAGYALYEQAADYFRKALGATPLDSLDDSQKSLYNKYVGYTFESGKTQEAIALHEKIMPEKDSEDYNAWLGDMLWYKYYAGDYAGALRTMEMMPEELRSDANNAVFQGKIYRENGMMDKARECFTRCTTDEAIEEDSSNAEYAFALLGNTAKARELFEKRQADDPENVSEFGAACLMALIGDKPMAVNYLRQQFENGFRNFFKVERDEDLQALKGYGDYEALLTEYKATFDVEKKALLDVLKEETYEAPIQLVGE
ncbi:MAG: tetratricopeptide repeat protein [Prevotella sp.]|nr:tetratricopeptide repeat protein [Prevotella sp.]